MKCKLTVRSVEAIQLAAHDVIVDQSLLALAAR